MVTVGPAPVLGGPAGPTYLRPGHGQADGRAHQRLPRLRGAASSPWSRVRSSSWPHAIAGGQIAGGPLGLAHRPSHLAPDRWGLRRLRRSGDEHRRHGRPPPGRRRQSPVHRLPQGGDGSLAKRQPDGRRRRHGHPADRCERAGRCKFPQESIPATELPLRTHEILEDALRDELSGEDDYGSGTDMASVEADVDGTRELLSLLAPLLRPRAPDLMSTVTAQLDTLDAALSATQVDGQWVAVDRGAAGPAGAGRRGHRCRSRDVGPHPLAPARGGVDDVTIDRRKFLVGSGLGAVGALTASLRCQRRRCRRPRRRPPAPTPPSVRSPSTVGIRPGSSPRRHRRPPSWLSTSSPRTAAPWPSCCAPSPAGPATSRPGASPRPSGSRVHRRTAAPSDPTSPPTPSR